MTSVKASRARHLVISGETYGIDDVKKLYVRVGILLKGGKHFQDHIISLSGVAGTQKTSPIPLLFIEVPVPRQERVMRMRDRVNDLASGSMILILELRWCLCFIDYISGTIYE